MARIHPRPPLPPFDRTSAIAKVRAAERVWNTREPSVVAAAYTEDCEWRNRSEFIKGRDQIEAFLQRKWSTELDYTLRKELWAHTEDRIAVTFEYEWHDLSGQWWRSYGNEMWEFDAAGYMTRRQASINDAAITYDERRILGPRPDDEAAQA
jgi:uncharacterized protein